MREPCGDPQKKNVSVRGYWMSLLGAHNQQLRQRARKELIQEPDIPGRVAYLWRWWSELDRGRRYGMNGAEPLAFLDIESWARLSGRRPTHTDIESLIAIDRVVLNPGKREG